MPDSLEFPGMRRAVVPLMRAGDAVIQEFVTDCLPGFPTVIGTLYQLPKPGAVLRGIEVRWVSGRSLQMEYLPARKMRASNLPLLARCIGSQNECPLAGSHQYSYTAHLTPLRCSPSPRLRGRGGDGRAEPESDPAAGRRGR